VMTAQTTHEERPPMQHGDFTHVEIPADDPDRAKRFYTDLFGWSFQEIPGFAGYHLFTTPAGPDGVGGAIGVRGQSAPERMRSYVQVASIDETVPRVSALGGSVVGEKQEVPGQGWYAVLQDCEGNEIAIWESAPRA
jgi:predicted enzyme related to lactoylglutathione lyase